jgi:uncharacterized protein (TIGR02646 family)
MRAIAKGTEPLSLTAYRQTPGCDFDDYKDKDGLRYALVTEQRGICCYCMGRIHIGPTSMKIEHWHCQNRYAAEQLSYRNLLGACLGGKGQPPRLQHCDTRKADLDLLWNPAEPGHHIETRIRYEADGSIRSDDAMFNAQLNEVLNLNLPFLKNSRKGLLDAILSWWKKEKARLHGSIPRARLERERDRLSRSDKLQPYCQVIIWWLEQRLSRMPA